MKCPYCNEEMKKGTLPNETHPYWLPEGERDQIFRFMVPTAGVRLALDDDSPLHPKRASAYYCPKCRIVLARTEK